MYAKGGVMKTKCYTKGKECGLGNWNFDKITNRDCRLLIYCKKLSFPFFSYAKTLFAIVTLSILAYYITWYKENNSNCCPAVFSSVRNHADSIINFQIFFRWINSLNMECKQKGRDRLGFLLSLWSIS